uniref:CSN12-like protein n=1 Tax=Panagrolaimus sp. JU765 TaxID=591449 RepID=A0AC34PXM2_9BILA
MYLGCIPAPHVLEEYGLAEFQPVVDGVNHGDIDEFRKGLAKHSLFFLKSGIFLILEKLISLTYLALLKRLFDILNDGSFKMKLEPFFHCLKRAGEDISDLDEAGNIVAGLIADGKLKGYISQAHQTIVFSKKDAFPVLGQ